MKIKEFFLKAIRPTRRMDVRKAALSVIIASCLEIVVALVITVLYFINFNAFPFVVLMAIFVPVLAIGDLMVMRSSWRALSYAEQVQGLEQQVTDEALLNRTLRAQRHDFINHLQVVYSLLQLEEYDEAKEYLDNLYGSLHEVSKLLRTDNAAVNALLAAKAAQAQQRSITLQTDIRCRLDRLPIKDWEFCCVLSNLIDNAMDAAGRRSDAVVRISLWEGVSSTRFSVSNNGPMIPRGFIAHIFEPGITTKTGTGSGMGLYIVKTLLNNNGGDITVESTPEDTRFSGHLPYKSDRADS